MAGRDNVMFGAPVANGAAAGTVIPLSLMYGIENVRQGYGVPILKSVRGLYTGVYSDNDSRDHAIPISIKNSSWVDAAGVVAQKYKNETTLNRDSLSFMRGRDKQLTPNTSWVINAELPFASTIAGYVYVLFEIEYPDVAGFDTEALKGSPVMKTCKNASITAAANVPVSLGSFDNLIQNTEYILSEASVTGASPSVGLDGGFLIIEGFSNQKGLIRIIPVKSVGLADQIEGSVKLTKQTYNLSIISTVALSAAPVAVYLEMIANKN